MDLPARTGAFFTIFASKMRLSEEFRTILLFSREEAARTGCKTIAAEHLLLAILRQKDNLAVEFLREFGLDLSQLKTLLDQRVFKPEVIPFQELEDISFSRASLEIASSAILETMLSSGTDVSAIHLLSAICDSTEQWCSTYLHTLGIRVQLIRSFSKSAGNSSSEKSFKLPSSNELSKLIGAFYSHKEEILS